MSHELHSLLSTKEETSNIKHQTFEGRNKDKEKKEKNGGSQHCGQVYNSRDI